MRNIKPLDTILALGLCFLLTGCGKLTSGNIHGRVVNQTGSGVAAATVMVEGLAGAQHTSSDGSYTYTGIAPGRYNVQALKQGYLAAGVTTESTVSAQRTRVMVDVQRGATTEVPDIVLIEGGASIDSVAVTNATPELGVTLYRNTNVTLTFTVSYSLQTADSGHLMAALSVPGHPSGSVSIRQSSQPVSKGAGVRAFSFSFSVPDTQEINLTTAITNDKGVSLSSNTVTAYVVSGTVQSMPTLKAERVGPNRAILSWSGGSVYDISSFAIERVDVRSCDPSTSDTFRSIDEVELSKGSYSDSTIFEGFYYRYRLTLTTKSGQTHNSNNVCVAVPKMLPQMVNSNVDYTNSLLVMSPVQSVLYVFEKTSSQLIAINTVTNQVIRKATITAKPDAVTINSNGETIYGLQKSSGTIWRFDASTLAESKVKTGLLSALNLRPDLTGERLFVSVKKGIQVIRVSDGEVVSTHADSVDNSALALDRTGKYLFYPTYTDVKTLDTTNLTVIHSRGWSSTHLFASPYDDEVYMSSGVVYETGPPWRQLDLISRTYYVDVLAVSKGTVTRMYSMTDFNVILVIEMVGMTRQVVDVIRLNGFSIYDMCVTPDGSKLYMLTWSSEKGGLFVYDLAARDIAKA